MESSGDIGERERQEDMATLASELHLTLRQSEVLHWVAEGKSNGEIGTIIGCTANTVKAHLKEIFQRLGLHSRTAAAACAYRAHFRHARRSGDLPGRVIPGNLNSP
jgi:DNA-binding CsgD family transcriptional regulator